MNGQNAPLGTLALQPDGGQFIQMLWKPAPKSTGQVTGQVAGQVAGKTPESQPESQPESLEIRVLRLLANTPLRKVELSAGLGQKAISGHLNQVVRIMLADETIEPTIPGKPTSRLQKYRLTEKGRAWLAPAGKGGAK